VSNIVGQKIIVFALAQLLAPKKKTQKNLAAAKDTYLALSLLCSLVHIAR
jgi:hypothetical protein